MLSLKKGCKNRAIPLKTKKVMQEKLEGTNKVIWADGRRALIEWYQVNRRALPWREKPHPYAVWLCEIIMQQTRIDQGLKYWHTFMNTWTDVHALASAPLDEILKAWQGLGYYSRARNLHRAAQTIAFERDGVFPHSATEWKTIPGVGPYTAAAIASICYNEPVAAVDGNVLRVISRYVDIKDPIDRPIGRKQVDTFAAQWIHPNAAGTHNQAVMELGALVCKPQSPLCPECPLESSCVSAQPALGGTPIPPIKMGKTKVKTVNLIFNVVTSGTHVWMRERPIKGIWGGLWEFPTQELSLGSELPEQPPSEAKILPTAIRSRALWGEPFEHILSHRKLRCQFVVWHIKSEPILDQGQWLSWPEAEAKARPRAIDRCWEHLEKSCLTLDNP